MHWSVAGNRSVVVGAAVSLLSCNMYLFFRHPISVQLAPSPFSLHVQVLHSNLNVLFGVHTNPGWFGAIFFGAGKHNPSGHIQASPFSEQKQRLQF